jgi:uncharacterized protein YcbX
LETVRTVIRISTAPVKGFALDHPNEVDLTEQGVVDNRRFFLVDGDGRRLRSSLTSWPVVVRGAYDPAAETLRVAFPDGEVVERSALGSGELVPAEFSHGVVEARVVEGEWNEKLSALAGHPVRIARPRRAGECYARVVTLLSTASIARLEREAGRSVDARRFRLLFAVDGCSAHEEDTWIGRRVQLGDAIVRLRGPIDRCAVTTRHPETGVRDLDTLGLIKQYRGLRDGKHIDFGVFGDVERPGRVRVGDPVVTLA